MANSTKKLRPAKPQGSPLYAHPSGQWAKKIRGRLRYFGTWADHDAALDRYNRERVFLERGLPVPERLDGLTVRDLCNAFLSAQKNRVLSGEITQHHFDDLLKSCKRTAECLDPDRAASTICPADFTRLRRTLDHFAPKTIQGHITRIRILFSWAWKTDRLDNPVKFGAEFVSPSKRLVRAYRNAKPARLFGRDEMLVMLSAAGQPLECMLLLGLNCGFGNHDIASLQISHLDLAAGWVDFPREKTGIRRRVPLWPETVDALKEVVETRVDGNVFVTRWRNAWTGHAVGQATRKLLKNIGTDRDGVSFYSLRHTTQTIGGDAKDPDAVRAIMGHSDNSMSGAYREGVPDARLRAVTDTIRTWLFGEDR